jgi:hypothetical protein
VVHCLDAQWLPVSQQSESARQLQPSVDGAGELWHRFGSMHTPAHRPLWQWLSLRQTPTVISGTQVAAPNVYPPLQNVPAVQSASCWHGLERGALAGAPQPASVKTAETTIMIRIVELRGCRPLEQENAVGHDVCKSA